MTRARVTLTLQFEVIIERYPDLALLLEDLLESAPSQQLGETELELILEMVEDQGTIDIPEIKIEYN